MSALIMKLSPKIERWIPRVAAAVSGLLVSAAFPPLEWWGAAWLGLVPLLLAVRQADTRSAARLGFLAGACCWLTSIQWLTHVTVVGWIILSLYCALYFMPIAVVFAAWTRRFGGATWWRNLALMLLGAAVWAGSEYVRSNLLTGFPWNPLGATQYRSTPLIQIARWGGVYAVSALVVFVNLAATLTMLRYAVHGWRRTRFHPEIMFGFLAMAGCVTLGWSVMKNDVVESRKLRVALIQPNIPQDDKWTSDTVDMIYGRLRDLTTSAAHAEDLHLLVWPETAVPDDVRYSETSLGLVYDMVSNGVPLLVGSMDTKWNDDGPRYYNSSFLFDRDGAIVGAYNKRHLVVFGEYIPFQPYASFIKALTPIQESFSPGFFSAVFDLSPPGITFSVLICFEDTMAKLARECVRNGARLLINQTNDAWFDPSSASRQQMIQCIFRCVENNVPAARATNTGVSCVIDRFGRVRGVLAGPDGQVRVAGYQTFELDVPQALARLTFYTRHGDLFARSCAIIALLGVVAAVRQGRADVRRA